MRTAPAHDVRAGRFSYQDLTRHPAPLTQVGALLDARGVHPGRTARSHLRALAATHGIGRRRVDEVVGLTGIDAVANRRVGTFSLGMAQRLGVAAALLGDPEVLVMDEPINGLDPDGTIWIRNLMRAAAAEGRTVFLSSHLMSEMAQTADHLVGIGRGRLIADAPMADVLAGVGRTRVTVRTPDAARLVAALAGGDVTVETVSSDELEVTGLPAPRIAEVAAARGIPLHELATHSASLEEAYLALTRSAVEFAATPVHL